MADKRKRRSNDDILTFIRELPGGNVPQYAKLLNTSCVRINTLLLTKDGQKLVKNGSVTLASMGKIPQWATSTTPRGYLDGRSVDKMFQTDTLPPFIARLMESIHPRFRDDALNFFREALDQTARKTTFEDQMEIYIRQDQHRTDLIVSHEEKIGVLQREADSYVFILEQAKAMKAQLTDLLGLPAPAPATGDHVTAEEPAALAAA